MHAIKARFSIRYRHDCPRLPGIDRARLSRYIQENIPCIRDAGRTFLHGDHRPANLIVRGGRLTGIIDLNRYDWGDPVHDFLKTAFFTRATSIPFSVGQIDGYHEGAVPSPCSGRCMRCIAP
ncbi:MAG: phosphotransferase [Methanomicrobiales archaeon]|nr:phosphotransferase [Methanomicrobiales archaeon]